MNDRAKIIEFIQEQHKERFRVIDNTGVDKKVVAGQFPDILFLQQEPPPNNNILFVLKVETGKNLVDNLAKWKALGNAPSAFYIVVPKSNLEEARKLATATDVRARFAWYEIEKNEVKEVNYE